MISQFLAFSASDIAPDVLKLHDELLRLQQLANENKIRDALFLQCLALLAPKLNKADQLAQWFTAYVNPAINSAGHRNDVVKASQNFFLAVLKAGTSPLVRKQYENGTELQKQDEVSSENVIIETPSQLYFYWIFQLFEGGNISKYFTLEEAGLGLAERKRFIIQNAKTILTEYGKHSPYNFFMNLSGQKFLDLDHRLNVLSLVSSLVGEHSDANLSEVSSTSFMTVLHNSLLHDNSTTALQMSINIFVMLIPHIAPSVNLQKLLVIFGRVSSLYSQPEIDLQSPLPIENLKFTLASEAYIANSGSNHPEHEAFNTVTAPDAQQANFDTPLDTSAIAPETVSTSDAGVANGATNATSNNWKVLEQALGIPDLTNIDISPLFTMLYGLYPHSTIAFSNSPSFFLKSIEYKDPLPVNWSDYRITTTIKSILPQYLLNLFMVLFTPEQELTDKTRWERMGSIKDISAHCLGLHITDHTARLRTYSISQSTSNQQSNSRNLPVLHEGIFSTLEDESKRKNSITIMADIEQSLAAASMRDPDFARGTLSPSNGRMSSPKMNLREASQPPLPDSGNAPPFVMSPPIKSVGDLLNEHNRLYNRRSNATDDDTPIPSNSNLNDSIASPVFRHATHISAANSPMVNPFSNSLDAVTASPLLIAQSEPSSSVTQLTVTSPLNTTNSGLQRNDTDPEPLRLSPTAVYASNEKSKTDDIPPIPQGRTSKQHSVGTSDSSILFYQRELMLLKNEFDFVLYSQRHLQYQYYKILEERSHNAIYNDSVFDLVAANRALRKKIFSLEERTNVMQKSKKTVFDQQKSYETSLLQKNKDLRSSLQETSRKASKLEIELERSKNEGDVLFESIVKKETKIAELELKITELTAESLLAADYKKALADADEKVVRLEQKTANFLSPEESDQVSNFLVRIKELTSAREAAESARIRSENQYRRQITNLQAQLRDYQEKQRNPSSKLTQSFEDFKRSADEQYTQLSNAHKDLAEKYSYLNDEFRKYITAEEVSRSTDVRNPVENSQPKSLLGYDIMPEANTNTMTSYTSDAPSTRSSTSTGDKSVGGTDYSNSPLGMPVPVKKKAGSQVEQQTRIRGRGGVQNTIRKKEPQPPPARSGMGHFRGFM